jgi:hypothetical protein
MGQSIEGIETSKFLREAMLSLKNFKQGALLERSLFTGKHQVSKELRECYSQEIIDELVRKDIGHSLAKKILEEYDNCLEVKDSLTQLGATQYELQLMVLPLTDLKHIVEYCIRQIPEETLSKIRKNEP